MDDDTELTDAEFLRDLAELLRNVPVIFGMDGYHIDRLEAMASRLEQN